MAAPLFGMVAAFATVQDVPEPVATQTVVKALSLSGARPSDARDDAFFQEDRFQRGDTLAALLDRLGVDDAEADRLLRSPQAARPFRLLHPGTTVEAKTGEDGKVQSLWFLSGRDTLLSIDHSGDGFSSSEQQADLARRIEMKSGEIRNSLFGATDAAGVPDNIAVQIADIFAGDVDFRRDLRRGDRFAVVYEAFYHDGRTIKSGQVLAAEFVNQKQAYRAVWFQDADGKGGYYTPEGKSLRKAFLRSPLEFSRITSGFGMRRHPIFHQWRAHKGIDYAAPIGTRVKATGDGMVEFAGQENGYGYVIVLRHRGGYSTYYAHLSRFAHGIRRGTRVAQGDVIGYVGKTGWATGPHLHYEFRVNNQYRNPLTIAFPAGQPVPPQQLAAFRQAVGPLAADLDLLKNTDLALLE
ncbi:MAG: peptidoglycan DD-metalloendopeptidase family protein [Burkholderiales bacterium]